MEQEFDLRPYAQAILRSWRLIVILIAVFGALAVMLTLFLPRSAQVIANILVIPKTSQITLDPRYVERDATMLTNSANQRQALVDLASSPVLEARVAQDLGLGTYRSGELLDRIQVVASSDLIQIAAAAPTQAEAQALSDQWARSYETLVTELYTGAALEDQQLLVQLEAAQERFKLVQDELDTFYASGELVRAQQQVQRLEGLLDGGTEAQVRLYTEYLTRTQELSLILEDARSLQAQYQASDAGDLNAVLAALAVRTRLAGAEQIPLQLNFDSAESFAQGQLGAADLASFVAVLEDEHRRMVGAAEVLASDLSSGDASQVGLPAEVRARYEGELAIAHGALARGEGAEQLLLQQRKVALSSLEVLQAKRDEGQIAEGVPEISVRYIGVAAIAPQGLGGRLVVSVALAIAAALFLSLTWIIGRELARRLMADSRGGAPIAAERPADHPVASD